MLSHREELLRKSWHMVSGLAATPLVLYTSLEYATIVALASTFFVLSTELLSLWYGIRVPIWARQLERVRRPEEHFSWASIGFLLTLVLLFWVAPLPVAFAAAGMLAFGDAVSALVGRRIGHTRIPWNRDKSWEGSVAGFLAGLIGALVLVLWFSLHAQIDYDAWQILLVCAVGSGFGMFAESLPRFQDNVTIPLLAGASMLVVWAALGLEPTAGALFDRLPGLLGGA